MGVFHFEEHRHLLCESNEEDLIFGQASMGIQNYFQNRKRIM